MLLAVAIVPAVLALPSTVSAASIGTLQARVDQARAQARSLVASVQARSAELTAVSARAAEAAQRQQQLEASLAQGRERLARLRAAAAVAHQHLLVAQARFRRGQRQLARRLVAIYKSDSPDMTSVLLEADGFSDLLTRAAYMKEINRADAALVNRVEALRDGVRSWLGRMRQLRTLAANEVVRITASRNEVAQIRAQAQARAAALQRARAAQQASLAAVRSRMAGWSAQVRALQQATGNAEPAGQWFANGDFSIPNSVVMCESGGNYRAVNPNSGAGGAYQFLPDTYKGLGGKYKSPEAAPKWEQDQLAKKLWNGGAGAGNWACAK